MRKTILKNCWLGALGLLLSLNLHARSVSGLDTISVHELPPQARHTLALIQKGGPFPYEQDGKIFNNFEKILPLKHRGYYREFTVKTPRKRHRGARRIVAGGQPPLFTEYFYTEDHYASFKQITK